MLRTFILQLIIIGYKINLTHKNCLSQNNIIRTKTQQQLSKNATKQLQCTTTTEMAREKIM